MLGESLAIGSSEAIIGAPLVALVFHEKDQATTCMSQVTEACLFIFVLAAPPSKDMPA